MSVFLNKFPYLDVVVFCLFGFFFFSKTHNRYVTFSCRHRLKNSSGSFQLEKHQISIYCASLGLTEIHSKTLHAWINCRRSENKTEPIHPSCFFFNLLFYFWLARSWCLSGGRGRRQAPSPPRGHRQTHNQPFKLTAKNLKEIIEGT